ncbi:MAG: hypothetical protein HQL57_02015 [Magnetococcales bacterium]|nr:hypothetical protein [Magnetococcales bacterium]MBF0155944.1 hypothetical protein [Magnetococcales bacterium]
MSGTPENFKQFFQKAVEAFEKWPPGEPEPTLSFRNQDLTLRRITNLVWACQDALPVEWCHALQLTLDSTYADGARQLRYLIVRRVGR